eukprot:2264220-Rhodomonas_salina.1
MPLLHAGSRHHDCRRKEDASRKSTNAFCSIAAALLRLTCTFKFLSLLFALSKLLSAEWKSGVGKGEKIAPCNGLGTFRQPSRVGTLQ